MLRMPELLNAPPSPVVFAPETVMPEMERFPPEAILKILNWLSPLMINEEAASPVIVRVPALEVAAIVGSAACRVMVVLAPFVNNEEAKIISLLALVALASVIACLNEPGPESAVVVTVITRNCSTGSVRLELL